MKTLVVGAEPIMQILAMTAANLQTMFELAVKQQQLGAVSDAERLYREILAAAPNLAPVHYNLGLVLKTQGRFAEAAESFRRALEHRPHFPEAANNLGTSLQAAADLDDAITAFQSALKEKPTFAEAWNNLGGALKDRGEISAAINCLEQSVALQPENAAFRSNLIYTLHYSPAHDSADFLQAAQAWNREFGHSETRPTYRPEKTSQAKKRLRIGYISAYFRAHCQSLFLVPLLSQHDHEEFEIFCYAEDTAPDAVTTQLRSYADAWRNIAGLDAVQIAAVIRTDQIDLLMDLSVHSAQNYLRVFALKPAPVQGSWLGYPGTTGLSAIDFRLSDPWLEPPRSGDQFSTEKLHRLPDSFWCYDPLAHEPSVYALPALSSGQITFGCLNNFCKVNDSVLSLWAAVLAACPNSRLILMAPRGEARRTLAKKLGIESARLTCVEYAPRADYLRRYHEIDLVLDTYPYNGHTTSLDALWMGVPVISLCGSTAVSRAGLSFMSNLDLSSLVATSVDAFTRNAVELAHDLPRLASLRHSLRSRLESSPLMNAPRFARNIENAYRGAWERWIHSGG